MIFDTLVTILLTFCSFLIFWTVFSIIRLEWDDISATIKISFTYLSKFFTRREDAPIYKDFPKTFNSATFQPAITDTLPDRLDAIQTAIDALSAELLLLDQYIDEEVTKIANEFKKINARLDNYGNKILSLELNSTSKKKPIKKKAVKKAKK